VATANNDHVIPLYYEDVAPIFHALGDVGSMDDALMQGMAQGVCTCDHCFPPDFMIRVALNVLRINDHLERRRAA
jgi:hypothetical protein